MVRPRNSATGPRAPPGSAKKMVPASEIATAASPAALNAWSSISRESPDPPAPWACEARRARRNVPAAARLLARPVAATPRPVARSARMPRPVPVSSAGPDASCSPWSGCGAVAGSTAPSCQVRPRHAAGTRRTGEPSGTPPGSRRLPAVISTADHPGTSGSPSLAGADPVLTRAVDEARVALVEQVGADVVGDPQGFVTEGEHAVTQYFDCTQPGYPGWRWAVTVAHAEGHDGVTIDEIVLLPGEASITAPPWVPYRERIQPGDLSPGDILPTDEDDARLVPAYLSGDPGDDAPDDILGDAVDGRVFREVSDELGLGRARVLSLEGRELAADRWYDERAGPRVAAVPAGSARLLVVRLPGPAGRPAGADLRGLRQRVRQRRRPRGRLRSRLWRPLRGPAAEEAAPPAGARPELRHDQPGRSRGVLRSWAREFPGIEEFIGHVGRRLGPPNLFWHYQ